MSSMWTTGTYCSQLSIETELSWWKPEWTQWWCRRGNGHRGGGTKFAMMDATAKAEAMDIDSEQQLESTDTGAPQVGN